MDMWGDDIPGRGNSKFKNSEANEYFQCWRISKNFMWLEQSKEEFGGRGVRSCKDLSVIARTLALNSGR